MQDKRKIKHGIISSWIVIGMSLILFIAVGIQAAMNFNREKMVMQTVLSEKGSALIKSFEAGTRTGMMGSFGSESRLQTLLSETASQKDILYIVLVDPSGKILAHNDPAQLGRQFLPPGVLNDLDVTETPGWRTLDQNGRPVAFEVFKRFMPALSRPGHQNRHEQMMNMHQDKNADAAWCQPGWMEGLPQERILDTRHRPIIFIGMDPTPYVEAQAEDFKLIFLTSAIILLLGMAGVVSLFWAHSYTRSKKLLQDSRAFASEMVANLPEGIIVTDPKHAIKFINPIACKMLKLDGEKIIGQNFVSALPETLTSLMAAMSPEKQIIDQELIFTDNKNKKLVVAATVTDIISEAGDFVGSMVILRDLTQIRRLQSNLQQQEKLAAIGNLAAGVAHEVRNPLSSIKGYATYFASLFSEDSEKKQAAEIMTAEVDRLNRVISELLEISRPSDIKRISTDLVNLITSTLRIVQQDAETARVNINTSLAQDMPALNVDPDRITQALINLYINGIQAMPDGGELSVGCRSRDRGVELTVTDTGTGMSEETINKIFDPYFTTKNTGTGLGLAVVQKVVEAHGGSITVESTEGKGTRFTIFLPDKTDEATL